MDTIFWGIYSFSIFGLGHLLSLQLVFFGSLFCFHPIFFCLEFIFFGFYFSFSLSLLFMELFYTHFRLFIVANLIPPPPFISILYITMYSYVLFLLLCEYIYFVQLNLFSLYNVFIFAWLIRYPIYRGHCTGRKLKMYWGLE
jgi:hypothetical protein